MAVDYKVTIFLDRKFIMTLRMKLCDLFVENLSAYQIKPCLYINHRRLFWNGCLAVFGILRKEVSDGHGFNMDPPIKIKRYIRMGISSHVFHLDPYRVTVHEVTQGRFFVPFPDGIRIGRF